MAKKSGLDITSGAPFLSFSEETSPLLPLLEEIFFFPGDSESFSGRVIPSLSLILAGAFPPFSFSLFPSPGRTFSVFPRSPLLVRLFPLFHAVFPLRGGFRPKSSFSPSLFLFFSLEHHFFPFQFFCQSRFPFLFDRSDTLGSLAFSLSGFISGTPFLGDLFRCLQPF